MRDASETGDLESINAPVLAGRIEFDMRMSTGSDVRWAVPVLKRARDEILASWLEAASAQPFHATRPDRVVSDHIPRLYDAVLGYLTAASRSWRDPGSPLDDPAVLAAANAHARARAGQGIRPGEVVTEFRLLRRAIWQGLRSHVGAETPAEGLINAELLVNDAIDGAITIGLVVLTARVEEIRDEFLVTTIHDIRQPITTIKGLAQLANRFLSRQPSEVERAQHALTDITRQVDQLNQQFDVLIDLSRAALGEMPLRPARVDLTELIQTIVRQMRVDHLREFRFTAPEQGEVIGTWDETRLTQVIANLLSNALKYSPPASPIEIAVHTTAAEIEVLVRDYGVGVEPAELPIIFRRYYRTQHAIESNAEGSGIGLYLCRQVIEAHRGKIWAESEGAGKGTTIRFTLPRDAEPPKR